LYNLFNSAIKNYDDIDHAVDLKITQVGGAITDMADSLKCYVRYSIGNQRALETVETLCKKQEIKAYFKHIETRPGFRNSPLSSFLIKPVQRICRYPLLIKEIIKATDPSNSTNMVMEKALRRIEATLKYINEVQAAIERELGLKRAQDELNTIGVVVNIISPTRSLILDGPINVVATDLKSTSKKKHKGAREGYFYLFNDFFLFVPKKSPQRKKILIPIDEALIKDPGENALEIIHVGRQIYIFISPTYHDKVFFTQKLEGLIEEHLAEACKRRGDNHMHSFDYEAVLGSSSNSKSPNSNSNKGHSNDNTNKNGLNTSKSSTVISMNSEVREYNTSTMPRKQHSSLKIGSLKLIGRAKKEKVSILNPESFVPNAGDSK